MSIERLSQKRGKESRFVRCASEYGSEARTDMDKVFHCVSYNQAQAHMCATYHCNISPHPWVSRELLFTSSHVSLHSATGFWVYILLMSLEQASP